MASGSIAFDYVAMVLPQAGLLDEAVSIFDQAVAQARRRGDILNVAFMSTFRGYCQIRRGDLRAAVTDLREAIDLCVARGMLAAWPYSIGFLAYVPLEQGEADEAARVIDQGDFPEQLPLDQVPLVLGFGSAAAVCASRPEAPSGESRNYCRLAIRFGSSPSTIQAACRGGAGPPKAFDSFTATTKRVRSPTRSPTLARRWGDPYAIGASLRVLGLVEGGTAGVG